METYKIEIIILLIFCLIFGGIAYNTLKIDNIENQIADMPQRVCYEEENTFKITLEGHTDEKYFNFYKNSDNLEYVCEEGVEISKNNKYILVNHATTERTCIFIEKREVCEIV